MRICTAFFHTLMQFDIRHFVLNELPSVRFIAIVCLKHVQWGLGLRTPLFTNNSVYEQIFRAKMPRDTKGVSDYEHNLATAAN
jgi:hypothetical protein